MFQDQTDYKKERAKNKKSPREEDKWIDDALRKLKKASTEYKRSITSKLKQTPSIATLWLYTQYMLLRFYSEVQLRNDLGNISLTDGKNLNFLKKIKGGSFVLIMRDYKVAKQLGEKSINISKALSKAVSAYIKFRSKVDLDHNWLLSNSKGKQLSKHGVGKALRKLTSDKLGKSIGTRMLRVFNASKHSDILEKAEEISNNMLHSAKRSKDYVRK